jgi:hypothetical protein
MEWNMDVSRKAFEQWCESNRYGVILKVGGDTEYNSRETQVMWESWQASRSSIEIELPESCSCCYIESEKEWHDAVIGEIADILIASGIKIKE